MDSKAKLLFGEKPVDSITVAHTQHNKKILFLFSGGVAMLGLSRILLLPNQAFLCPRVLPVMFAAVNEALAGREIVPAMQSNYRQCQKPGHTPSRRGHSSQSQCVNVWGFGVRRSCGETFGS